jgi:hypothetical protein
MSKTEQNARRIQKVPDSFLDLIFQPLGIPEADYPWSRDLRIEGKR